MVKSSHYFGNFIHTPRPDELSILEESLITVDSDGVIVSILSSSDSEFSRSLDAAKHQNDFVSTSGSSFFIPGLVDLHIHAPQWPQMGKALHLPLHEWLTNCTFPLESRYDDLDFARTMYTSLVQTLLDNGTTSAVYFATVHAEATQLLAELCLESGQRAWVGRVAMDHTEQCPEYYRDENTELALSASETSIHAIRSMANNQRQLVQPILTPRFIPACTDELLYGLGQLASKHHCAIQTHCSESDWEHQFVKDRCGVTDTVALDKYGLLTRQTILAHSNFLTDDDMSLVHRRGAGIAHCPLSNAYFADSVFPLRAAIEKGLRVGLGTDISGGASPSQFETCRQVVSSSRMLESGVNARLPVDHRGVADSRSSFVEAFYLATAGGAQVLDANVGRFEVGCQFDALLIDPDVPHSNLTYWPQIDTWDDLFQKMIYTVTRPNIVNVWVDGVSVKI